MSSYPMNANFTEEDYESIAALVRIHKQMSKNYPLPIQSTVLCALLAELFPLTKLFIEEFLDVINNNVRTLIEE